MVTVAVSVPPLSVGDVVGEGVGARVVGVGGVGDGPVTVDDGGPVGRVGHGGNRERVTVYVAVVRQDGDGDGGVFGGGLGVVDGGGSVVGASNGDGDGGGVGPAVPVGDVIGEGVGPVEVGVGGVGDGPVHR